jgi:hypothetical protein
MDAEKASAVVQRLRVQRLTTMSLADQITEDRWREAILPGNVPLHDMLAHILAWDEWAIAVFEISLIRELPPVFQHSIDDVDAFNARAQSRYRGISRDDMLSALQSANPRLIASAESRGSAEWYNRQINGLLFWPDGEEQHAPTVGEILRVLRKHESEHDQEIMATFNIAPKLDQDQE